MKKEKFAIKFKELMEHLEQRDLCDQNSFAMMINSKEAKLIGFTENPITLTNGIILIQSKKNIQTYGYFNKFLYQPNTEKDFKVILALDGRKTSSNKVYIRTPSKDLFFDKNTELQSDEKIYIFWQYGPDNCLITIGYDAFARETICDFFFISSISNSNKLKIIFQHLLDLSNNTSDV